MMKAQMIASAPFTFDPIGLSDRVSQLGLSYYTVYSMMQILEKMNE